MMNLNKLHKVHLCRSWYINRSSMNAYLIKLTWTSTQLLIIYLILFCTWQVQSTTVFRLTTYPQILYLGSQLCLMILFGPVFNCFKYGLTFDYSMLWYTEESMVDLMTLVLWLQNKSKSSPLHHCAWKLI